MTSVGKNGCLKHFKAKLLHCRDCCQNPQQEWSFTCQMLGISYKWNWGLGGFHIPNSCVYTVKHIHASSFKQHTLVKDTSVFLVDLLYSSFITKDFESSVIIKFCVCLHEIECLTISVSIYDFSEKYKWKILHKYKI